MDVPGMPALGTAQAWLEIHREDLMADWELAVNGQTPFPIEPLRLRKSGTKEIGDIIPITF